MRHTWKVALSSLDKENIDAVKKRACEVVCAAVERLGYDPNDGVVDAKVVTFDNPRGAVLGEVIAAWESNT